MNPLENASAAPCTPAEVEEVQRMFGVHYWQPGETGTYEAPRDQLYQFRTSVGAHLVTVERGDSVWFLSSDREFVHIKRGPVTVESAHVATVVRGYTPAEHMVAIDGVTNLPYVNGCSTRQLVPPARPGDPTFQLLVIPPYSAEQAHHIHPTVRVVYVLRGRGVSVVGLEGKMVKEELVPGKVCILDPMCPHHFETPQGESLVVVPLHVFSSVGGQETNHPMYRGTFLLDQGR